MNAALLQKIKEQGMDPGTIAHQIQDFENGFPYLKITAPAREGDGIRMMQTEDLEHFQTIYPQKAKKCEVVKFVPASGAASRMFKDLFGFLDGDGDLSKSPFVQNFMDSIEKFAFYDDLNAVLKSQGSSISDCLDQKKYKEILAALLQENGLGYGSLPKGLLKFHRDGEGSRTPAEEHLIEGIQYAIGKNNTIRIHFTVSPEHEEKFKSEVDRVVRDLEDKSGSKFEVSFSQQKKSTDTIAVTKANEPFLEEDGSILFRPAGHGALLENLNDIHADLIFIKNIDNVVPDRLKDTTTTYKQVIGGLLLEVQERVFKALELLDQEISEDHVSHAKDVYRQELYGKTPDDFDQWPRIKQYNFLREKLDRPMRVCGMVKNTGEPGGGPFWIAEEDGSQSLQILETAQINEADPESVQHLQAATHFNPVDLVCATRNYKGDKFDLLAYRDMRTGFITEKSKNGQELKALELPGLWNGSMSNWTTLFVEVPLITFNPVKTVNDLLRAEHQG